MQLSIIPVVIAAMHGDLSSDLAAHETRRMHVRIGGPVPERVEEAGEVMLIEGLIVGGHVQCNDVVRSRCAGNRTGGGLRAIGFLRDSGNSVRAPAEKRHYRIIAALQTKVNVRK